MPSTEGSIVPVIDVGPLIGADSGAKLAVAKQIGQACEEIGFFIVVNHGVPVDVMTEAWQKTLDFFDQPLEAKLKFVSEDESKNPYGYSALGGEVLSLGKTAEREEVHSEDEKAATGDLKEMYQMGPQNPAAGMPPRQLPQEPEGFANSFEAYYEHVGALAQRLLGAFALALDLPEDWFNDKMDRHLSALRANNYPTHKGMTLPAGSIRCSAHTDYGTLTVLKSGGPGLQVSKDTVNVEWHDVPVVEDGFVINLGDLMRRWTNERWCSTLHRVINPSEADQEAWGRRMSMAFFHNLNKDAVVEAIPSCISNDRPALYAPIVAGEFLMLKHMASNGKADPNAHFKRQRLS